MILVDFYQTAISSAMPQILKSSEIDTRFIRHITINALRRYHKQFSSKYGEMVLCCDSKNNWRKDIFPQYKGNRRKTDSVTAGVSWSDLYSWLEQIKNELRQYFPMKVIFTPRAEGDDIIAVIAKEMGITEEVLIISSDKDFIQLQSNMNIHQWAPIKKKFIQEKSPTTFLREHIIGGDASDGIPNIRSDDDSFVNENKRQRQMTKKRREEHMADGNLANDPKFQRNRMLIDLDLIPRDIQEAIRVEFHKEQIGSFKTAHMYCVQKKLNQILEHLNDFKRGEKKLCKSLFQRS